LLAGCGSQNLAPLEEKTTDLREDNHQLKLDILLDAVFLLFSLSFSSPLILDLESLIC
jgi:hypothetical protein